MKKLLIITIIAFNAISAFAQTQTFDIMTFTPPKGWQTVPDKEAKVFAKIDKATSSMGIMSLYPSIDSTGNAEKDFKIAWDIFVKKPYGASDKPETETSRTKGFAMISGGETIKFEGIQSLAILTVLSGNGRLIILLTISNEKTYLYESTKIIEGMSFDLTKATIKPVQSNTTLGDGEKFDLWMTTSWGAYKPLSREYSLTEAKVEWFIVYPNGDYYPHLPDEGFLNFSRANLMSNPEKAKSWGKLTFTGNKGRFKSIYDEIEVVKLSPTQMEKTGSIFKINKVLPVDNLRISGAFSLGSPNPNYAKTGCQSVIHFTKDGRFDDRGIFISCSNIGGAYPQDEPGVGTYQLKNFTIILQYNDGRVKTRAFSGGPGVSITTQGEMVYIGGNAYFKN